MERALLLPAKMPAPWTLPSRSEQCSGTRRSHTNRKQNACTKTGFQTQDPASLEGLLAQLRAAWQAFLGAPQYDGEPLAADGAALSQQQGEAAGVPAAPAAAAPSEPGPVRWAFVQSPRRATGQGICPRFNTIEAVPTTRKPVAPCCAFNTNASKHKTMHVPQRRVPGRGGRRPGGPKRW